MTPTLRPGWRQFALVTAAVALVDQLTKSLVRARIETSDPPIELLPFLDLRHVHNTGVAFGLFAGRGAALVLLSTVVVGLVLLLMLRGAAREGGIGGAAVALIAGGAVGNLVDRARLGHVTDFIHFPHWPTFNIADVAITAGVVIVLVGSFIPRPERSPVQSGGDDAGHG